MYTTLFFDLGEVVLTNDWTFESPEKDEEFTKYYGLRNFNYAKNPYTDDLFTGKISEVNFWEHALKFYKAKTTNPAKAIEISRKYQKEKDGMLRLLEKLKINGYTLGAITNIHNEMLQWKTNTFQLHNYFSHIISSSETGWRKPDKNIYLTALERFNVHASECICIDDNQDCVDGANAVGIKGILFTSRESLLNTLKNLSITI